MLLLAYTVVVYKRSVSRLAYPTTQNVIECTKFLGSQGIKQYVLSDCQMPFTLQRTQQGCIQLLRKFFK